MAIDFGYPDYVAEILNELRELKKEVAKLQREVAELSKKVAKPEASGVDAAVTALREGVQKLDAAVAAVVENLAAVRSLAVEDRLKRDETCMAVLERLILLQESLSKILK